jgi:hypothetical protein
MVELKEKGFSQRGTLRFHAMKWNRKMQFVTEEEEKTARWLNGPPLPVVPYK